MLAQVPLQLHHPVFQLSVVPLEIRVIGFQLRHPALQGSDLRSQVRTLAGTSLTETGAASAVIACTS